MTDPLQSVTTPDPNLPMWARKQQNAANPLSDERMLAFIGPKWPTYQVKFAPFLEDPAFVPTWNWSAAFFQPAWFLYRKLYFAAFGFMLLRGLAFQMLTGSETQLTMTEMQKPENRGVLMMWLAVGVSSMIAAGGVANWLLFRRARAAVRIALAQEMPNTEELPWLARVGGTSRTGVALVVALNIMVFYAALGA
ncbi:MAG: DUF2628 domain-containing protein [Gemmatimonas sp.]